VLATVSKSPPSGSSGVVALHASLSAGTSVKKGGGGGEEVELKGRFTVTWIDSRMAW